MRFVVVLNRTYNQPSIRFFNLGYFCSHSLVTLLLPKLFYIASKIEQDCFAISNFVILYFRISFLNIIHFI